MTYDSEIALRAIALIAGIGVSISGLEDLAMLKCFSDQGLLSWEVNRLENRWSTLGPLSTLMNRLISFRCFRFVLLARMLSAVLVAAVASVSSLNPTLLFVVFASSAILSLRSRYGLDGAHQMWLVLFGSLFLAHIRPPGDIARVAALWFIAIQTGLSYFVAGAYKTVSRSWWNGQGLIGVLGTITYGNNTLYKLVTGHLLIARLVSWAIMVFECSFWFVFVGDTRIVPFMLALGVIFHVGVALTMGLNDFLLAFPAAYPAVVYCVSGSGIVLSAIRGS